MKKAKAFREFTRWLCSIGPRLGLSLAERALFELILTHTVLSGKLTVSLPDEDIKGPPNMKTQTLDYPYSHTSYKRARKGLVDKNLVFIKGGPSNRVYTLNAPWIIAFLFYEVIKEDPTLFSSCTEYFDDLLSTMDEHMPEELRGRAGLATAAVLHREKRRAQV